MRRITAIPQLGMVNATRFRTSVVFLITAFLLPATTMAREQTDTQDADSSSSAAVIETMEARNETGTGITAFSEDFLRHCAAVWGNISILKNSMSGVKLALDASKAVDAASTGHWYSGNDEVEKLQSWVENQSQLLRELSYKSSNDWLMESGFNSFNASTMPTAQDYLDGWIQEMTNLQQLLEAAMPVVAQVKLTVGTTAVGSYSKGDQLTTVLGSPEAMDEIWTALSSSEHLIDTILEQLRSARSVAFGAVNQANVAWTAPAAASAANSSSSTDDADADEQDEADDAMDAQQQNQQTLPQLNSIPVRSAVRNPGQAPQPKATANNAGQCAAGPQYGRCH